MCGIYGMVSLAGRPLAHPQLLERMGEVLRHRGPDGAGAATAERGAVGARRLRIVDPRPQGDQPFGDGRRWLVCNGEIYNAKALRSRFGRYPYRSRSDVEPLLPLLAGEGAAGLDRVDGMYGLAWWDAAAGSLLLARDRAGEKPLFYLLDRGEVWFASEVQALLLHPAADRRIDEDALLEYLALGYVREPRTMHLGIRRVPAGTSLHFAGPDAPPASRRVTPPPSDPVRDEAAPRRLGALLQDAVAAQTAADVPVGVFASGGVDSSLVAALAASRTRQRLTTFAVRIASPTYDEGDHAALLARSIGSRHVEVVADEAALTEALDTVTARIAEPVADPAILPTYLLSARARREVGVVLSGEGADELFGGYPTYDGHRLAGAARRVPAPVRHGLAALLRRPAASGRRIPLALVAQRFLRDAHRDMTARHVAWFGTGLFTYLPDPLQARLMDTLTPPADAGADGPETPMALDYRTYLRDGLLVKLDRATMLASLEARAPYLSGQVTAFAQRLARSHPHLLRSKAVLKAAAAPHLPASLVRRRKQGLSVPVAGWLRAGLREEMDRLRRPHPLFQRGVLSALPIEHLVNEHQRGAANHGRALWALLLLRRWYDHWGRE